MTAITLESVTPLIVVLLGTGGFAGLIVAIVKLRPEAEGIAVVTAQGALIVATGVIDTLREENERLGERVTALEAIAGEHGAMRERVSALEDENAALVTENGLLRERVESLEQELATLRTETLQMVGEENGGHHHPGATEGEAGSV